MATLTFDTHDFVKKLKIVGFSEEQAEVLTELQKTTVLNTLEQARHEYDLDDLATKRDMKDMEIGLRRDMKEMELKLQKEIAETKADLVRWVVGVGLLQITIIAGLIFRLTNTF